MGEFVRKLGQQFEGFGAEVLQSVRGEIATHEDEACFYERQNNIATAAVAMRDAGLDDETIRQMLQKHWDLRRSETQGFIGWAHRQIPDSEI